MSVLPQPIDASLWPNICFLQIRYPATPSNKVSIGTGTLIGPRVILTAGHVVFDATKNGWAQSILVTLGASPRMVIATNVVRTIQEWIDEDPNVDLSDFDYGVVILPKPVDATIRPMPFETTDGTQLRQMLLNQVGYPAEPPPPNRLGDLFGTKAFPTDVSPTRFTYPIDTYAGQSGGPVYDFDAATNTRTIRGVHTNGSDGEGSALRIIEPIVTVLSGWLQEFRPV